MTYRPDQIVVGYYDAHVNRSKVKCGFPSCRWLKDNNYTEVASFARLTKGIKPHLQRDSEKQISKDLGVTVGSFTNDFIDGFKFTGVNASFVVVLDPRGFHVMLPLYWLNAAITDNKCSIDTNGTISGKWSYLFENKRFKTLVHENGKSIIDVDDNAIEKIDNEREHFKLKDLEVGTAYDKNGIKTNTRRYVYIGEHNMHSLSALSNYLGSYAVHAHLLSHSSYFTVEKEPWKNDICIRDTKSLLKSYKKWPIFILLEDKIEYYSSYWSSNNYCDVLSNDSTDEHSIRYNLRDSNLIQDMSLVKRIVKKSDCQDIKVMTSVISSARKSWHGKSQCYSNPDEYKLLSFVMIVNGFNNFLCNIDKELKKRFELSPVIEPEDIAVWRKKVDEYKMECKKTGKPVLGSFW